MQIVVHAPQLSVSLSNGRLLASVASSWVGDFSPSFCQTTKTVTWFVVQGRMYLFSTRKQ